VISSALVRSPQGALELVRIDRMSNHVMKNPTKSEDEGTGNITVDFPQT